MPHLFNRVLAPRLGQLRGQASTGAFGSPVFACARKTGRAQGVVKAGRRAGLPLASMLPGHALTEAQQVLHARCNWPLTSALPVTPDHSVDKKRSKHYRRRFVSLACQNEPAAPPRSYLLLEIARVVGLLGACEQCQLEAKRVAEQRGLNRTLERGFSGLKCGGPCAGASAASLRRQQPVQAERPERPD